MIRASAAVLLSVLTLSGCGLASSLERTLSEDENTLPAEEECQEHLCGACLPSIHVTVYGEAGQPVPEVTVSGPGRWHCSPDVEPRVGCWMYGTTPGDFAFEVHAPGYKTLAMQVTVPATPNVDTCCNCGGYEPQLREVTLERE